MITYKSGNILQANTQALVNTVNTVGVMGKVLALQFKKMFPLNFRHYEKACKENRVTLGKVFIVQDSFMGVEKFIINFPTKNNWKNKSRLQDIVCDLQDLLQRVWNDFIQTRCGGFAVQRRPRAYPKVNLLHRKGISSGEICCSTFHLLPALQSVLDRITPPIKASLDSLFLFIAGYETPLGLELLATVHWLATQNIPLETDLMLKAIANWCNNHNGWGDRKVKYFKPPLVETPSNE